MTMDIPSKNDHVPVNDMCISYGIRNPYAETRAIDTAIVESLATGPAEFRCKSRRHTFDDPSNTSNFNAILPYSTSSGGKVHDDIQGRMKMITCYRCLDKEAYMEYTA